MKLRYFGYTIKDVHQDKNHLVSLTDVFAAFCGYHNPDYKNQFTRSSEHLYFLNVIGNLYMFVQTKNEEVIKKINSDDISAHEISESLNANESIGFASYVYVKEHYLGFASTVYAPRITAFCEFMDDVLATLLGRNSHQFIIHPFINKNEKQEVLDKGYIGKSTMEISRDSGLFADLVGALGGDVRNFDKVNAISVQLKPVYRKDISDAVKPLVRNSNAGDFDKFVVAAKNEVSDALKDYYLDGEGMVSDTIERKDDETQLRDLIETKINDNAVLSEKVSEHEADDQFTTNPIGSLDSFSQSVGWSSHFATE